MYTVIQGRAPKRGNSYTVELGRVDSFVEAVRLAQLAGGACVRSEFSRTSVKPDEWWKTPKDGKNWKFHRLQPICTRVAMLVMMWLIQRS